MTGWSARLGEAWRLLRSATGEDRWDQHVEHCRLEGRDPGTRADFERARADRRAATPGARCC